MINFLVEISLVFKEFLILDYNLKYQKIKLEKKLEMTQEGQN